MIGFESTFLEVLESSEKVEICVNISQPSSAVIEIKPFNLTVRTKTGTAGHPAILMIADSVVMIFHTTVFPSDFRDFLSINQTLEGFGNSKRRQCFNVTITDDDVCEDAETFTVTLEQPFDESQVKIQPGIVTVTIIDCDGKGI